MPEAPVFLQHLRTHCTGEWQAWKRDGSPYWRCSGCQALYDHSVPVTAAALLEKRSGERLRQLTNEGTRILKHKRSGES